MRSTSPNSSLQTDQINRLNFFDSQKLITSSPSMVKGVTKHVRKRVLPATTKWLVIAEANLDVHTNEFNWVSSL